MSDDLAMLRACLQESRALRTATARRGRYRARHRRRGGSGLLLGAGALLVAIALPATAQGLQPVLFASAPGPRAAAVGADAAANRMVQQPSHAPRPSLTGAEAARGAPATVDPEPMGAPVRVAVPAVGIDSDVIGLGLDDDGSMLVPRRPDVAAWYDGGPLPGRAGPALLVGHLDSQDGPAVFYRLREVVPGDRILVSDADGRTVAFEVDAVSDYRKDAFPTRLVFEGVTRPELRLITCSGSFDRLRRSYTRNFVVFAHAIGGSDV